MYIQTESTPNPDTMKFLPGLEVVGKQGPFDYRSIESASNSPLAQALFSVTGVEGVFLGSDFVSITKSSDQEWKHVRTLCLATIMDHFVANLPVMVSLQTSTNEKENEVIYDGETAEIVAEIKELIDTRVRPAVARDGGDIVFHGFDSETGLVQLHMRGACAGCPSSTFTLKQGIENLLRTYVPEVTAVEAVL